MRARYFFFAAGTVFVSVAAAQVPIPVPSARATAFHDELFSLWLLEQSVLLAVPAGLLLTGWGALFARRCMRWSGGRRWLATLLFAIFLAAMWTLAGLGVELFRAIRLAPYSSSLPVNASHWLLQQALPTLASIIALAAVGFASLTIIRRSRNWWWLWVAGSLTTVASIYLIFQPVINGQLQSFPRIEDTAHAEWAPRLAALAARAGAHDVPILVVPTRPGALCNTQSHSIGLGPTRAIALAEQIFPRWEPAMVESSFAHELKHYLYDNTWFPVVLIGLLSSAGALGVFLVGPPIARKLGPRAGTHLMTDDAALPLLLVLLQLYLLIAVPAFHLTAQVRELDADRFSMALTDDSRARALVAASRCGDLWLAEDPLFERLYLNTHPSTAKRIRTANEFRR
jgi:STE24 endopeptidase